MNKINELGDKVRLLREEKGLSRPVFCGDESELSVRQLVRIEKGEFRPTIKTLKNLIKIFFLFVLATPCLHSQGDVKESTLILGSV